MMKQGTGRRRLAAVLCLALGMAALAGCGSSTGEDAATKGGASTAPATQSAAASGETITLRILENDTAKSEGYLDVLLSAFNEAYRDQGIVAVDANMEEYSNLAENGPYGYGPDVLYQANDKLMAYAEDKHILALAKEDYDCAGVTPDEAWDAFAITVDGARYLCGVPVNVQEPMLFYRKDLLPEDWTSTWDRDADGTPDMLQNWSDLYAFSRERAQTDGQYGLGAPNNDLYMMAEYLFSYGGYVFGTNEDGSVNAADIGFARGNAALGLMAMRQFAGLMGEECLDDSIKQSRYARLADGTYFCTISTPDTWVLFHDRLAEQYEAAGESSEEADRLATENIGMVELPGRLPADGDLSIDAGTRTDADWLETRVMGGVNGYGISAYTKHREACVAFVNFATSSEMVQTRAKLLGIAPTRSDVAAELGGVSGTIFESLSAGRICLMPSIKAVDQIWDPMQTLLADVAKDAFRKRNGESTKYADREALQQALEKSVQSIYDAIFSLAQ